MPKFLFIVYKRVVFIQHFHIQHEGGKRNFCFIGKNDNYIHEIWNGSAVQRQKHLELKLNEISNVFISGRIV